MSKAETIALIKAFGGSGGSNSGGTQPDWNQNDETAPDYVKNRTHYVEISEVVQEKMLFDGRVQTCDYRELIAYTLNDDIVFDSETKYCVKIGDKVYKEISFKPLDDIYRHQFSYVNEDGESEEAVESFTVSGIAATSSCVEFLPTHILFGQDRRQFILPTVIGLYDISGVEEIETDWGNYSFDLKIYIESGTKEVVKPIDDKFLPDITLPIFRVSELGLGQGSSGLMFSAECNKTYEECLSLYNRGFHGASLQSSTTNFWLGVSEDNACLLNSHIVLISNQWDPAYGALRYYYTTDIWYGDIIITYYADGRVGFDITNRQ